MVRISMINGEKDCTYSFRCLVGGILNTFLVFSAVSCCKVFTPGVVGSGASRSGGNGRGIFLHELENEGSWSGL